MQHMGSMCCKVSGLLVLLAGLSFFAYGLGYWNAGMTVHLVAGALLALYGLGKLAHSMEMCPSCKMDGEMPHKGRR